MKEVVGLFFGFMFLLLVLFGIGWVVEGNNFFMFKFWAPKYEDVKRETYTHTQSYRQGNTQRLNSLCMQEKTAEPNRKIMINDVIAHEFADWNINDVPDYLQPCLSNARN